MAPITLEIDGSYKERKVRKAILYCIGVEEVSFLDNGRVVVTGNPDPSEIRARLERKLGKDVTIIEPGMLPASPIAEPWSDDRPVSPVRDDLVVPPYPRDTTVAHYGSYYPEAPQASYYYQGSGGSAPHYGAPTPASYYGGRGDGSYQSEPNDLMHYVSDDNANSCSIQ